MKVDSLRMTSSVGFFERNCSSPLSFEPFSDELGLPFPLNLNQIAQYTLLALYIANLVEGSRLRRVIWQYMRSPESNLSPINYLIWFDQINGLYLFVSAAARIMFMVSPVPVSSVTSTEFCQFMTFIGLLHMAGTHSWGSCIAIFRYQNCSS